MDDVVVCFHEKHAKMVGVGGVGGGLAFVAWVWWVVCLCGWHDSVDAISGVLTWHISANMDDMLILWLLLLLKYYS